MTHRRCALIALGKGHAENSRAVDRPIADLHTTMLHLLGIDHTRPTFPFSGRDMRLTDVHGEVVRGVLA